jgi:hypothetical protein
MRNTNLCLRDNEASHADHTRRLPADPTMASPPVAEWLPDR